MRRDELSVPTFSAFNKVQRKMSSCCCNGANVGRVHYLSVQKTISNNWIVVFLSVEGIDLNLRRMKNVGELTWN